MAKEKLSRSELEQMRKEFPEGSIVAVEFLQDMKKNHAIHYGDRAVVGKTDEYGYISLYCEEKGLHFRANPQLDILRIVKGERNRR